MRTKALVLGSLGDNPFMGAWIPISECGAWRCRVEPEGLIFGVKARLDIMLSDGGILGKAINDLTFTGRLARFVLEEPVEIDNHFCIFLEEAP